MLSELVNKDTPTILKWNYPYIYIAQAILGCSIWIMFHKLYTNICLRALLSVIQRIGECMVNYRTQTPISVKLIIWLSATITLIAGSISSLKIISSDSERAICMLEVYLCNSLQWLKTKSPHFLSDHGPFHVVCFQCIYHLHVPLLTVPLEIFIQLVKNAVY